MEQPSIIFPDKFFLVGSTFFGLWRWKLTHFPPNPNNSLIRLSRFSISVSHSHGESLTSIKLTRPRLSLNLSIFFFFLTLTASNLLLILMITGHDLLLVFFFLCLHLGLILSASMASSGILIFDSDSEVWVFFPLLLIFDYLILKSRFFFLWSWSRPLCSASVLYFRYFDYFPLSFDNFLALWALPLHYLDGMNLFI